MHKKKSVFLCYAHVGAEHNQAIRWQKKRSLLFLSSSFRHSFEVIFIVLNVEWPWLLPDEPSHDPVFLPDSLLTLESEPLA